MYILDTDILVDYLRLHPPALRFFKKLEDKDRKICFLSQFELLQGCDRKIEEQKIGSFLKHFKIIPLTGAIAKTALQTYRTNRWKAYLDIVDSFIAATALAHKLTVVTRNMKHYRQIPGIKVEKPY
jgi:tRNA(fMet)-specific endonuclease VapC